MSLKSFFRQKARDSVIGIIRAVIILRTASPDQFICSVSAVYEHVQECAQFFVGNISAFLLYAQLSAHTKKVIFDFFVAVRSQRYVCR